MKKFWEVGECSELGLQRGFHRYVYMSKLIKMHTLNICSSHLLIHYACLKKKALKINAYLCIRECLYQQDFFDAAFFGVCMGEESITIQFQITHQYRTSYPYPKNKQTKNYDFTLAVNFHFFHGKFNHFVIFR